MNLHLKKREVEATKTADLAIFPLNRDSIQRLARVLNSERVNQTRLMTASTIVAMLEPVFIDIENMEALAAKLIPARPDLVNDIRKMRIDAEHLRQVANECFGAYPLESKVSATIEFVPSNTV